MSEIENVLFPPRPPWQSAARALHAEEAATCPAPDCHTEEWPCRLLPNGMRLHLMPMIVNLRLTIANQLDAPMGWTDAWCYDRRRPQSAMIAFLAWDGEGDPPGPWKKHVTTGRRGPGADRPDDDE